MPNKLEFEGFLPNLSGLLENPRAEQAIFVAFLRIYEYFTNKLKIQEDILKKLIVEAGKLSPEDINGLVQVFSTPLAGSSFNDPLLQSIIQSFGPQGVNTVFAGPTPSFRALLTGDIPNLDASKITSGAFALVRLPTNILKTDATLIENVVGAPNANTGKTLIKDNAGNQINVMTCI